jgi:hypothetical protein
MQAAVTYCQICCPLLLLLLLLFLLLLPRSLQLLVTNPNMPVREVEREGHAGA